MHAVLFSPRALKALQSTPASLQGRLLSATSALAQNPRPPGCRKLAGALAGSWRIRVGFYRVLYDVDDAARKVLITAIGPRKSVYH